MSMSMSMLAAVTPTTARSTAALRTPLVRRAVVALVLGAAAIGAQAAPLIGLYTF